MARDASVTANRVIWLAQKDSPTATVADGDWSKFEDDERKGLESFNVVVPRTNRVQPGFTWDEERTLTDEQDGSIDASFAQNALTMKLFFGTAGRYLFYRDYEDGIGTGKPLKSGVALIEAVADGVDTGTMMFNPTLPLHAKPVRTTQA